MLGRPVTKQWVDWAYDMLCAGFETENLLMFAGETEPYNQWELQRLTDKIFSEHGLRWDNEEIVYRNYICYLINEALDGRKTFISVLVAVKHIYDDRDREKSLQDFAMLYWAKDDLDAWGDQSYWPDATKENIDAIIEAYFRAYLKANECT